MGQTGSSILGQEKKGDHSSNSLLLRLLVPDFDPDTQSWKKPRCVSRVQGEGKGEWGRVGGRLARGDGKF